MKKIYLLFLIITFVFLSNIHFAGAVATSGDDGASLAVPPVASIVTPINLNIDSFAGKFLNNAKSINEIYASDSNRVLKSGNAANRLNVFPVLEFLHQMGAYQNTTRDGKPLPATPCGSVCGAGISSLQKLFGLNPVTGVFGAEEAQIAADFSTDLQNAISALPEDANRFVVQFSATNQISNFDLLNSRFSIPGNITSPEGSLNMGVAECIADRVPLIGLTAAIDVCLGSA